MSAAAMQFYDGLLAKGVQADEARKIAEGFDAGREHDRQQAREYAERAAERAVAAAKEHAEQVAARAVAQSEEKGKATFATKEQVAQLPARDEFNGRLDALQGEIRELNRHVNRLIMVVIGVGITLVAGLVGTMIGGITMILNAVGGL